ncbi:hypothetical protein RhiXN_08519 [Rhizoctonia solani]|uniref:Uncharacterized protein n=1 Tax=Rhizoctonia solani TaxID=456999 RepID=A0A8H8P457_9AGAM|nr:uncharacterized protein RhiXN_08519 [Rhizoctonia solani]QRW23483.1 hypothetical protein RhiXN_08519 [Rhizoctonia solani]
MVALAAATSTENANKPKAVDSQLELEMQRKLKEWEDKWEKQQLVGWKAGIDMGNSTVDTKVDKTWDVEGTKMAEKSKETVDSKEEYKRWEDRWEEEQLGKWSWGLKEETSGSKGLWKQGQKVQWEGEKGRDRAEVEMEGSKVMEATNLMTWIGKLFGFA